MRCTHQRKRSHGNKIWTLTLRAVTATVATQLHRTHYPYMLCFLIKILANLNVEGFRLKGEHED